MLTSRLPEDQPKPMRLIDQTPAQYIDREVARLTEHDSTLDTQFALHMTTTSLAQVIADDIAAGEKAWPATVARYVEARDRYRKCVEARALDQATAADRVFDLAGDNDPQEWRP